MAFTLETAALPAANRVGMISADKQKLLNCFLCKLPEPVASRLAKAVEVDRLTGGLGLPHEVIVDALRPRLRQAAQHTRMPTPQRFFCQPFEDLLIARQRNAKQKGRIARSSIEPVWNWLANELMPTRHRELTDTIRDAIRYSRLSDWNGGKIAKDWLQLATEIENSKG